MCYYNYKYYLLLSIGFSIEGPSKAKIDCHDNGDGSADVKYFPMAPGEYAVHILCDNEDIPKSPYIANVVPSTDFYPDKVINPNEHCLNASTFCRYGRELCVALETRFGGIRNFQQFLKRHFLSYKL